MTDTKHTPGPWEASEVNEDVDDGFFGNAVVIMHEDDEDYLPGHVTISSCQPKSDANLIAAAPDLLEALEGMLDECNGDEIDKARAAIKRARGES